VPEVAPVAPPVELDEVPVASLPMVPDEELLPPGMVVAPLPEPLGLVAAPDDSLELLPGEPLVP